MIIFNILVNKMLTVYRHGLSVVIYTKELCFMWAIFNYVITSFRFCLMVLHQYLLEIFLNMEFSNSDMIQQHDTIIRIEAVSKHKA